MDYPARMASPDNTTDALNIVSEPTTLKESWKEGTAEIIGWPFDWEAKSCFVLTPRKG